MKKRLLFIHILYIFLLVSGSVHGVGERTVLLGGDTAWKIAEYRNGVAEVTAVRPYPVLALCSSTGVAAAGYSAAAGVSGNYISLTESALDMSLSFDAGDTGLFRDSVGNYKVIVSSEIEAVDRRFARAGTGAALFGETNIFSNAGSAPLIIKPYSRNALFAPGNRIRDFTLEFWLYPLTLENGEQILSWVSSKPLNGNYAIQRITCVASKNRLKWSFINFFTSTGGQHINVEFSGAAPVVPKTWSHHLVRFDAATGVIEYIVNGSGEAIAYTTPTGREGGEVYTPVAGNNGVFMIGEHFMGLMDEFKIHSVCAGRSSLQKYAPSGGRVETAAIDLGDNNSGVLRIDVSGGRTGVNSEFRENGRFRFRDDSEMQFFIRASENPYRLNENTWSSFIPGADIAADIHGRYVQIAVDFYPSADGETSPYLDELRVIYMPGRPPLPPGNLTASAVDSGVLLRWKHSPDVKTSGYLVYYSSVRGELFGEDSSFGASPIDAGKRNSLLIDGLKNGTLYYFRVASYNDVSGSADRNVGEFSREVTARPLAGISFE